MARGKINDEVAHLLPLRVSDDLTADEAAFVDRYAKDNPDCQEELDAYAKCLDILRDAGREPLPVDGRPSLWKKIQPKLGTTDYKRRQATTSYWMAAAMSTPQLGVLAVALAGILFYLASGRHGQVRKGDMMNINGKDAVQPVDNSLSGKTLGVNVASLDHALAEQMKLKSVAGAIVTEVIDGSAAAEAGLKPQDVIVGINGKPCLSPNQLAKMIDESPNPVIKLDVIRDGKQIQLDVDLGDAQSHTPTNRSISLPRFPGEVAAPRITATTDSASLNVA